MHQSLVKCDKMSVSLLFVSQWISYLQIYPFFAYMKIMDPIFTLLPMYLKLFSSFCDKKVGKMFVLSKNVVPLHRN